MIENINNSKFNLISSDILQINNSNKVQFIISIFKLSLVGNDYAERKRVINFLFNEDYFENSYESLNQCFFINLSKASVEDFFSKISTENKFEFKHFLSLGILDAVKYCSSIFKLNTNDPFIIALIDNIFEFLDSNDNSIKTYLN